MDLSPGGRTRPRTRGVGWTCTDDDEDIVEL
jgi:hypothetical protein